MLSLFRRPRRNLVFVHLPKTGGTSARVAILPVQGRRTLIGDYGPNSKDTTEPLRPILYAPERFGEIAGHLDRRKGTWVIGHFRAVKYASLFDIGDFATFLREPYARLVSEYNHHVSRYGFDGRFEQFLRMPRFRNIMSRGLEGVDIDRFGFVGLTEELTRDFPRFLKFAGLRGEEVRSNVGAYDGTVAALKDEEALRAMARRLNAQDFELYDYVAARLAGGTPEPPAAVARAAAGIWGSVSVNPRGALVGWLGRAAGQPPRRVIATLMIGGKAAKTVEVTAERSRPDVRRAMMTDEIECGFVVLPSALGLKAKHGRRKVRLVDAETGLALPGTPIFVELPAAGQPAPVPARPARPRKRAPKRPPAKASP